MKPDLFADHSANESTFLSWVRTALSIVGFGLLVAKFGNPGALNLVDRLYRLVPSLVGCDNFVGVSGPSEWF
jgi:uncharacterized membrane protein YidH (DUF202 family)